MEKQQLKTKNIFYNSFKVLILVIVFSFSFLAFNLHKIHADSCSDQCTSAYPTDPDQEKQCEDDCNNLNKKAKVYQELIDIKNKQQDTLASQLDSIAKEQDKNKLDLQDTTSKINDLGQKIDGLESDIKSKEEEINVEKKILAGLMQSYYDYDQQGILDLVLVDKNFSETLSQADYLEQSGVKVSDVLNTIQKAKNDMQDNMNQLNSDREEMNKLKEKLTASNADLQLSENQKQSLMDKTQGEEQKYRDLLAHVEAQKKELFNFSSASNLSEINASVSSYPAPKDHLASTSWYFSQRDPRWASQKIGNSKSTMEDYGCAVASVAMVFRKLGSNTDPGNMAKQKIFSFDLINWPTSWSPGISLVSSISHGNINWKTIDSQISKGNPVIVYIQKTNGGGGHYVVVTGKDSNDYIVHDPYFGANLYLGTSKALVGKIGANSKVAVNQMIIYN